MYQTNVIDKQLVVINGFIAQTRQSVRSFKTLTSATKNFIRITMVQIMLDGMIFQKNSKS